MTETKLTNQIPVRPALGLRRTVALSAVVAFGLLAPVAAGASPAAPGETPPAPTVPGDLTNDDPCDPGIDCPPGPDDGDDCPPLVASCDFQAGGDGPDEPPTEDPGDELPPAQVDPPVRATPNYTG